MQTSSGSRSWSPGTTSRTEDTGTFHGDIRVLLDALAAAGFEHVLARSLDATEFEVSVARVVVPGLEPYLFSWTAYGERARRFDAAAFLP